MIPIRPLHDTRFIFAESVVANSKTKVAVNVKGEHT